MKMLHVSKWYLLTILVSLLPFILIFATPLNHHTHDGVVHLARIGAYVKALRDGQFPVRWAGDLNFGYGMPLFNFMYQVPYFIASLFVLLGVGLILSFKLTMLLSFLLSGIFTFLFAKAFFKSEKTAFFVMIFYQFFPFRLVELMVRGSFGEVYTYTFFPLVLYGIVKLSEKISFKNYCITSVAVALLILSHNALSLVFFGVAVLFVFFFIQNKKIIMYTFSALVFGMMLAAFYWVPAIFEHKYTYGDLLMQNLYKQYFPPLVNFFIPNFLNYDPLLTGGVSVQLGIFHTIAIILAGWFLFLKKRLTKFKKRLYIFCFVLIILMFCIMQPVSKFAWEHITLLRQFQFPWRVLGIVGFATALVSSSFLDIKFFQKKWIYTMTIILVILSTAYYWQPILGLDTFPESYYWNFPKNTTYFGETDVIWSEGPAKTYPKERVSFIEGSGNVIHFIKSSNIHTFTAVSTTSAKLVDRTEYFPGWRVYVNGKQVPIQFQNQDYRGLITFPIPPGKSVVVVKFGETPVRFISDIVSLMSLILLGISVFFRKKIFL